MQTYRTTMHSLKADYGWCPQPCKFVKGLLKRIKDRRQMWADGEGRMPISLQVFLEEMFQAARMDYNYGFISLVAEVGGYVGLFLGVAVVELHGVFAFTMERIFKLDKQLFALVKWAVTGFCVGVCAWQAHVCIVDKYLRELQGK